MSFLQILLLGPVEIRWEGENIPLPGRIPRAILFYLAARGNYVSRENFLSLLWGGEMPESTARKRLNENLSRLRSAIPNPEIIETEGDLIGLDPNLITVDLKEFENLIEQVGQTPWQIPSNETLPEFTVQTLQKAVALWRGPYFMSGSGMPSLLALDNWLTSTAAYHEHQRARILGRLADHAYVERNIESALRMALMALENDEYNENLHLRVMYCYIEKGHLNDAREHYLNVKENIQRELKIAPPSKLTSLINRLNKLYDGRPVLSPPRWEQHARIEVPFIGRKDTLQNLRQLLNQQKAVFILGEEGSGKTRLIQEFASQLQPEARSLVANCQPLQTELPFQPICEVFRYHITKQEWHALPKVWASQLTPLLPELQNLHPDLTPPPHPEDPWQTRAGILEAIRQVFVLLSKGPGVVFVLDNAHWADEATLSAINYLHARSPFDNNAHLAVIARQEEINPPLDNLLNTIGQGKHAAIIRLPRSNPADIADLTRIVLKKSPPQEFLDRIITWTGGNSSYVLETLRSILERDPKIDLSGDSQIPLTEKIQNLILSRIHRLDIPERNLLENAAIIGTEFDFNLLAGVSRQDEATIVQGLETLEKKLIIQAAPPTTGRVRYRFSHGVFREVLLAELSPAKTRIMQASVARFRAEDQAQSGK